MLSPITAHCPPSDVSARGAVPRVRNLKHVDTAIILNVVPATWSKVSRAGRRIIELPGIGLRSNNSGDWSWPGPDGCTSMTRVRG